MTEGTFPKVNGDVLYASEVNKFNTSISNTTGKVRGISSTYFDSLDGSNLTSLEMNNVNPSNFFSYFERDYFTDDTTILTHTVGSALNGKTLWFDTYISFGDFTSDTATCTLKKNNITQFSFSAGQSSNSGWDEKSVSVATGDVLTWVISSTQSGHYPAGTVKIKPLFCFMAITTS